MGQLEKRAIFERLVKEHLDSTTRVAIRLTGNQDLAEELVQETMLRAVRNWESFRHQAQFNTWLYRILINAFRDQHRTKPRVNFVEVQPNSHVAKSDPVEANVETTALSDLVGKLIAQLPERQREVLVFSTYEQLNNQQIADAFPGITAPHKGRVSSISAKFVRPLQTAQLLQLRACTHQIVSLAVIVKTATTDET